MAADKSLPQMGRTPPHQYLAQVGFALMRSLQQLIRTRIDRLSARYHDRAAIVVPPAGDTISIRPVIPGRGASIQITVDDDTQVEMDVGRAAHFELYEGRNREALADEIEKWIVAVVEFGARERVWVIGDRIVRSELTVRMADGSDQRAVYYNGPLAWLRARKTETTIYEPYQTTDE